MLNVGVTVLGDLRIDVRTSLDEVDVQRWSGEDVHAFEKATFAFSGTAMNAASALARLFARVCVISAVGDDPLSSLFSRELDRLGTPPYLFVKGDTQPPVVLIVRSRSDHTSRRLLISAQPSPLHSLSVEDVNGVWQEIKSNDVLLVDTYSLFGPASADAARAALTYAQRDGMVTCVDILPHDIYRHSPREVLPFSTGELRSQPRPFSAGVYILNPGYSAGLVSVTNAGEENSLGGVFVRAMDHKFGRPKSAFGGGLQTVGCVGCRPSW